MGVDLKARVQRTVYLPVDLAEKLAKRAAKEGKSNAAIIVEAVEKYLAEEEKRREEKK